MVRTQRILKRMLPTKAFDGLIDRDRFHNNQPFLYYLIGNPPPAWNFYTRDHEIDIADLFVAYYPHVTHWDTQWGEYEAQQLDIPTYRIHYDARMVFHDKVYLWEVDRGTEDMDFLSVKIDKYIALAKSLPYGSFQVIFTLQKYRRMSLGRRSERLASLLQEKGRGNQFLFAKHEEVTANPLGAVFVSPVNPEMKETLANLLYGV